MSAPRVAPDDTALLLIDHQVGTMRPIRNLPLDEVRRRTLALARASAILEMPVRAD
jgi:nicotinamidase-related amidase